MIYGSLHLCSDYSAVVTDPAWQQTAGDSAVGEEIARDGSVMEEEEENEGKEVAKREDEEEEEEEGIIVAIQNIDEVSMLGLEVLHLCDLMSCQLDFMVL